MTSRLAGKTALISGGARGQGAAHARRLAEDGASVLFGDILVDAGEAQADALRTAGHAVHFAENHLRLADRKFVTFTPHCFNEYTEMQQPASRN